MSRPVIAGNKLVLAGALLYLLEWVAIIPAGNSGPADPGSSTSEVLALYRDHPRAVLFLAAWCSLVLVGRVLIVTGLRAALRSVRPASPIMDLAVGAMTVSVAVEIASTCAIGAAQLASLQGHADLVVALDGLGGVLFACILPPLGLSIGLSSVSMLRSRAFPTWIPSVGCLASLLLVVGGLCGTVGLAGPGTARDLGGHAQPGVPLFWLWMIASGVYLARRPSHQEAEAVDGLLATA